MSKYGIEERKRFSPRERLAIWEKHKGACVICKGRIDGVREPWIIEHIIALENGGDNADANLGPAHQTCAIEKTKVDHSIGAKLKRVRQRHLGIKTTRSPLPGGRGSKWKKRMDGSVVRRDGEE
ncbi:HNHc domain containing protein [uncultured Caudovirales phage]|uniref:HNHc domain containing protein n=1 Tax=uncultured Caudovirales phage TaxID=2100421 RepID=A0A6J5KRG3_9CAUD|nr:HNHc domain containing protein [uncultured Caudovirales phage]CAB4123623.1 HNHc domain containing protein [uncultured Caudovirales phage]